MRDRIWLGFDQGTDDRLQICGGKFLRDMKGPDGKIYDTDFFSPGKGQNESHRITAVHKVDGKPFTTQC
jgi:hypothetical protein